MKLFRLLTSGTLGFLIAAAPQAASLPRKIKNSQTRTIDKPPREVFSAQETEVAPAPQATVQQLTTNQAATSASDFDRVPQDQADSLVKRLQLTAELIKKHGRAYDYRTMRTHELERVLTSLNAEAEARTRAEEEAELPLPPPTLD